MSSADEAGYVRRAQLGDREAFGHLVDRYRGAVFGLCLHLLGSVEDAQDATQDTFLRACQAVEQLRAPEAFPAWLATIARRECSHLPPRPVGAAAHEVAGDLREVTERLHREHLAACLRRHLERLRPDTRLIYLLSCLDGLDSPRIGAFLGLKPGAVRARLHRARQRLADALTAEDAAERREAFEQLVPEVIPVTISIGSAQGRWPEAAFPDDSARALYGYLYTGVPWQEAVARTGLPDAIAQTYLRTWERYRVVEHEGDGLRPLVPVALRTDRPAIGAWHRCLARRWTQATAARGDRIEALAQAAAPDGWVATAREVLCLWAPATQLDVQLTARGLYLPPLPRPSGPCHIFGSELGESASSDDADGGRGWGLTDTQTGDDTYTMVALIWWHCKHSPVVGKFLDHGAPFNPLPRVLAGFREDPPHRKEAVRRLEEVVRVWTAHGHHPMSGEDLLDRLIGWRVLSTGEPYRLLLPVFVGEVGDAAMQLGAEIAEEVAAEAEQGRETLQELVRGSSFARCNRSDVYHLLSANLMFAALAHLIDAALIPPFPEACFAERGPYIADTRLFG